MKFNVYMCRKAYDRYEVEAETPQEAALAVGRGKVAEAATDVPALHDYFYTTPGDVLVIGSKTDESGFLNVLCELDENEY